MKKAWATVSLAIVIGFLFILPSTALAPAGIDSELGTYQVRFEGSLSDSYIKELPMNIIESYDSFLLVEADATVTTQLEELGYQVLPFDYRTEVGFKSYSFDVATGEPELPTMLSIDSYPGDVSGYYIVQFDGPIKQEWKAAVEGAGGILHDFIPNFNYIVEMTSPVKSQVSAMDFVNWVGIYQPAYKINPGFEDASGNVQLNIFTFKGRDVKAMADTFASIGIEVFDAYETETNGVVKAIMDASMIPTIANYYGVKSISPDSGDFITNADATWILETDVTGQRTVMDNSVTGTGELVTVMDSELRTTHEMFYDASNPIGPTHRKIEDQYAVGGGSLTDGDFHGTHVTGTVLGDAPNYGVYDGEDGQAIGARVIFQDIDDSSTDRGGVYPPADLGGPFQLSYDAGSRIHQNSWGGGNGYTDDALEIDTFTWNNKDYNILFAMGNAGSGANTLSEQPEAKNAISVGGTQNVNDGSSGDQNDMYSSSSRGYADDGRIKPTILGVSQTTTSADNAGDTAYTDLQGTSMACPDISGQVAQIRQYFNDGYYPSGAANAPDGFNPSAALVKATLINGAVEITGSGAYQNDARYPNGDQGWGRSKLDDALYFSGDSRNLMVGDYDKGFLTGTYRDIQVQVNDGTQDLEFSFVWTDYPGADLADPAIVNDLDLEITGPTGINYKGNAYTGSNPGYSQANPTSNPWAGSRTGGYDGLNVEENALILSSVPTGTYSIRLSGNNVPQATQPYALVVTGGIQNAGPILQLYTPNGGESLTGNTNYDITWSLSDREDNDAGMTVDLYLSTDSGATYPITIATGEANDGIYAWNVNNIDTTTARVKIVVTDSGGLVSEDWSYADFTITASGDAAPSSAASYSGTTPTVSNPVTIDWSAIDDVGLTQVELFYQYNGGGYISWADATNPAAAAGTADTGSWSFNFPDGAGVYDFYTIATDDLPQTEAAPGSPDVTIEYQVLYNIDHTGAADNSWIFVSFPITASGDVLAIFDDAVWGDGGTTWDLIYWYDPTDANDPWKSYNKNAAALGIVQDMPQANNSMGFWLHLINAGGGPDDNFLTVGAGSEPTGTTINLDVGWNLVGYPAQDDTTYTVGNLKTDTGATIVQGYGGAGPYDIVTLADSYVLRRGEAYWVKVGAATVWTVNW